MAMLSFSRRSARLLCTIPQRCPYAILGLSRGSSAADIKQAYRREAMKHHPDRALQGDGQRFVELAVAYSTLTDEDNGRSPMAAGGFTQADASRILDSISDCRELIELLVLEMLDDARSQRKEPTQGINASWKAATSTSWDAATKAQTLLARYPSVLPVEPLPPSRYPALVLSQE